MDGSLPSSRAVHGHQCNGKRSLTYRSWDCMVQRTTNPGHRSFTTYGRLDVPVDPSFLGPGGFARFLAVVGERPSRAHTLDRIDPYKGYVPGNLRWALVDVQANNRCWARHYGRTIEQWAEVLGTKPATLRKRRQRGWSDDRLFPAHLRTESEAP